MIVTIDTDKLIGMLPEILERCKADAEPAPVPPTPPSPPETVTEKGNYSGAKNPPWLNFYFSRRLEEYPTEFVLNIGKQKYQVLIGTRRRGGPGMDGPDGKFYCKQSDVPGRGMAIGIHRKFATKDVSITYAKK